jgi:thiamine transport system permease protein
VGAMLVVTDRIDRRRPAASRLAPSAAGGRRPETRGERVWLTGNLALIAVLLLVPLVALVERSLRVGDGHGLAAWRALGERSRLTGLFVAPTDAVWNSLRFAAVATVVAVVLGTLAAAALARSRGRGSRLVDAVLLVPLGTSAVTVGFGFLITLDRPPVDLRGSAALVPLAQALVALPFVVRTTLPVLRTIDGRMREAAAVLGAPPWRVWREVDLPLIARATAVAAGFAFAISLGEFGATTVIARVDAPTVPVAIDRLLGRPGSLTSAMAFAMSTILMVMTAVAVVLADRVRGVRSTLL